MGLVVARRVILALIVLAGLCVAGWFWGLPRYRPEISDAQLFGVDVSQDQGQIEWEQLPASDIGFAYLSATAGTEGVDASFAANWAGAQAAGLRVGAYHLFSHCEPGAAQAELFLIVAPPDAATLPPAVRLDQSAPCFDALSPDQSLQQVQAFLEIIEGAHARDAVLQVSDGFGYLESVTISRRAWRRSLFRGPVETDWTIWQFHDRARVDGIDGSVSLNIANIDQLNN